MHLRFGFWTALNASCMPTTLIAFIPQEGCVYFLAIGFTYSTKSLYCFSPSQSILSSFYITSQHLSLVSYLADAFLKCNFHFFFFSINMDQLWVQCSKDVRPPSVMWNVLTYFLFKQWPYSHTCFFFYIANMFMSFLYGPWWLRISVH